MPWQLFKAPSLNLLVSLSSWPYLVALTGLDTACFVTSLCHPNCYIQAQSCSIHGTVCSSVCCIRPESSQQCPRPSDQSTMARCLHTGYMCSLAPATQTSSGLVSSLTMAAVDVYSSLPWQVRDKSWMSSIRFCSLKWALWEQLFHNWEKILHRESGDFISPFCFASKGLCDFAKTITHVTSVAFFETLEYIGCCLWFLFFLTVSLRGY